MLKDLRHEKDEMGVCNKCGATQLLSYGICNYNGICKGIVIPIVYRICDYCISFKTDENCGKCFSYSNWKAQNNITELIINDSKKFIRTSENNIILRKVCHNKGKIIIPEYYVEKEEDHNIILIKGPIYDEIEAQKIFESIVNKAHQQGFIDKLDKQYFDTIADDFVRELQKTKNLSIAEIELILTIHKQIMLDKNTEKYYLFKIFHKPI